MILVIRQFYSPMSGFHRGVYTPRGGGGTHPGFGYPLQNSRSCGCRLEKGGLSLTQELSGGGSVRGAFPVGAVVVSLASPRKASWISYN